MGVDFYTCERCGENFSDCGDYALCEGCEAMFCRDECGKVYENSCMFCRNEEASDRALFAFALGQLGLNREELLARYLEKKKRAEKEGGSSK